MAHIVKGETDPVEQPEQQEWTRASHRQIRRYRGVKAGIETKYNEEIALGTHESVRLTNEHLDAELEIVNEIGLASGLVDTKWELDVNIIRRDLRTHTAYRDIDDECMDDCENAISQKIPFDEIEWNTPGCLASYETELKSYYYHRKAGVSAYIYPAYVVRQTQLVTRITTVTAGHTGTSPASVQPLPGDTPTEIIGSLPVNIEWLKIAPKVRPVSDGKYEIVQEYWGGTPDWSGTIYGGTWDPVP
jgi:hypothetical protein